MKILSIIIPFYNSEKKCIRLLNTLSKIKDESIELIIVDDGSTDNMVKLLQQFQKRSKLDIQIIVQENKGLGGARNTGLGVATGEYIWFVDSDDDIRIDAIDFLKQNIDSKYDFIDFDIDSEFGLVNSMGIPRGVYTDTSNVRNILLENFGRICTKHIRREMILENKLFYPEYCIYEDNTLLFIYPFAINSFCKSELIGYIHQEEYESVTRSETSPRYFDRMKTALIGLRKGLFFANEYEREILYKKFVRLYLVNTAARFMTRLPSWEWLTVCRVMRQFRYDSRKNNIANLHPGMGFVLENTKFKTLFYFLWAVSYILPDQNAYFDDMRKKAWGRSMKEGRV